MKIVKNTIVIKILHCVSVCFLLLSLSSHVVADHEEESEEDSEQDVLAGHSDHGGAWNEGPRQAAELLPDMGNIDFPISSSSEVARAFFNQGIGQIHGFWYFEAERSFRQASMIDPTSAICYWGMAQANINNVKRARDFLIQSFDYIDNASAREKLYIESFAEYLELPTSKEGIEIYKKNNNQKQKTKAKKSGKNSDKERGQAYVKKLKELSLKYPDDHEAKALIALHMWINSTKDKKKESHLEVDAYMQKLFHINPMHPAHHYRIHLWDKPKPAVALDSAGKCGMTAKGIAHMWHMPGHIYSKEKMYFDAAWHQEASARVDHKHMIKYQVMPDRIHNFAHNNEWLARNLMKIGRIKDLLSLTKNMIEMPQHPKYNVLTKRGSSYYGRTRLMEMLNLYELWGEAIELCHSMYLEPTDNAGEQIKRLRLLMKAYYMTGDVDSASKSFEEVKKLLEVSLAKEKKELEEKAAKAAKKSKENTEKKDKEKKDIAESELQDKKSGEKSKGKNKNRKPKKPKYQSLNEAILAEAQIAQMLTTTVDVAVLKKIEKTTGMDKRLVVAAYCKIKDYDSALKHVDKKEEVAPLVSAVKRYYEAGRKEEAKKYFETLRKMSEQLEIDMSFFKGLKPIAEEFKYPEDWRIPAVKAKDVLPRPSLDELGPFRWRPAISPNWRLPDHQGVEVSLENELKKSPVLVIFYLGADCLHCVEQMNVFAPMVKEYADRNIKLMAVTLETMEALSKTVGKYSDSGEFPFPIVADPQLAVFKKYRAYDDFEKKPLHGTFLIDQKGRILWQDISYEPFTDAKFLLKECQRLLAQKQ